VSAAPFGRSFQGNFLLALPLKLLAFVSVSSPSLQSWTAAKQQAMMQFPLTG
jgi:hypothetical protein